MSDGVAHARVLCVDDEDNVLQSIRRHLRKDFDLVASTDPVDALRQIRAGDAYAVVVSDLRMPQLDGVEFLKEVRKASPDTTRIMLTGNADLESAKRAVNDGHIFRFLTKPCPPEMLREAIAAAVRIHELVVAERELLEQTLHGAVEVLTQTLSLANPEAFGRASRIRRYTRQLVTDMGLEDPWKYEVAAMFSQLGAIAIPPDVLHKAHRGEALSDEERAMIDEHPDVASRLLARIPRLEQVAEIVRCQSAPFRSADPARGEIPVGARVLRVALDFDVMTSRGVGAQETVHALRKAPQGRYDPVVLDAAGALLVADGGHEERWVRIEGLRVGMVVGDAVTTEEGLLIVAAGHEVTESLLERLHNWARSPAHGVKQPIRVLVPRAVL